MKHGDLVRSPVGTVYFFEMPRGDRVVFMSKVSSAATRARAKVKQRQINGFTETSEPIYLVRVEVIQQGAPRKRGY